MSKSGGVFQIFLRSDDVTRTMSKGGGVLVKNLVSVPGPPPPFKNPGYAPALSVFPTLSDGPSNTYTYWAGPLYKGVGPKANRPNGVFMVHMSRTDQPTVWGHNSQFHWISSRVNGSTCLSRPLYLYQSHLSVPNIHTVLIMPKKNSLTTAPSSGLV